MSETEVELLRKENEKEIWRKMKFLAYSYGKSLIFLKCIFLTLYDSVSYEFIVSIHTYNLDDITTSEIVESRDGVSE